MHYLPPANWQSVSVCQLHPRRFSLHKSMFFNPDPFCILLSLHLPSKGPGLAGAKVLYGILWGSQKNRADSSTLALLSFAVLCIVGCLTVSLASAHEMLVAWTSQLWQPKLSPHKSIEYGERYPNTFSFVADPQAWFTCLENLRRDIWAL